jgi:hypothetical protein
MAAPRNRPHVLVRREPRVDRYLPHGRKIDPPPPPPKTTVAQARALRSSLSRAVQAAEVSRRAVGIKIASAKPGTYLKVESKTGVELKVESLQHAGRGVELVALRSDPIPGDAESRVHRATVFIPPRKEDHFGKKLEAFVEAKGVDHEKRPSHDFVDRIASLQLAAVRGLWTDPIDRYPAEDDTVWWEVWLRKNGTHPLEGWMEFAAHRQIEVGGQRLEFEDRVVTLARASARQIAPALFVLDTLAELRGTKTLTSFFLKLPSTETDDWSGDLVDRRQAPAEDAPAVCVLDTGVNLGHPLLEGLLDPSDCHAYDPTWGTADHQGHGTEMAGLALYGDLVDALESPAPWPVHNRLESVKILPRTGRNKPRLYAAISADATSRVEIEAPDRRRTFSMAVTADGQGDRGKPTSWSAAIDALAAGRSFDPGSSGLRYLEQDDGDVPSRLFVISAGNVGSADVAHLDRSETEPIQDPAQAWNALTVGAFTEKVFVDKSESAAWYPVAPAGELSPWSTTSVPFAPDWPLKPDVVAEGGNAARDSAGNVEPHRDLSVLTTNWRPGVRLFVDTHGTSAATAQVARICASVMGAYPEYWPETIRALLVHSAEWTPMMRQNMAPLSGKRSRAGLVRRYGFGVPSLERALRSANDALTLVIQGQIHPFNEGSLGEMHLHELPWPKDVLAGLGSADVRLRVTLSYFVEPSPKRQGWKGRFQYPSHGLRFDINEPNEDAETLRKRVNKKALGENEKKPARSSPGKGWFLGEQSRSRGSLHADMFSSTAAELAERNAIAVYPVGGWWKAQPKRDRSQHGARYSLVISIQTEAVDVDLWTPVANAVGLPTTVSVPT